MSANVTTTVQWNSEGDVQFTTHVPVHTSLQPTHNVMNSSMPSSMFPHAINPYMTTPIPYYFLPYLLVQSALPALPTHEIPAQTNMTPTQFQLPHKAWYPDSGATNHFTQGRPSCTRTQSYLGTCKVQVANGSYLDITSIGTTVINAPSKPLVLHDLLYAPQITKNPVSISQFTKDIHYSLSSIQHDV